MNHSICIRTTVSVNQSNSVNAEIIAKKMGEILSTLPNGLVWWQLEEKALSELGVTKVHGQYLSWAAWKLHSYATEIDGIIYHKNYVAYVKEIKKLKKDLASFQDNLNLLAESVY